MTAKIAEACLTSNQYLERIFPKNKLPLYENLIVMIPQIKIEDYNYDLDCENKCNDNYKECWKQYFENKAKEEK